MAVSDKSKVFYLVLLILFIFFAGSFWLDYIGLINIREIVRGPVQQETESVLYATDDEPTLIEREEFEKQKALLKERIEKLDAREALLTEKEKKIEIEREKINEIKKGLALQKSKYEKEKTKDTGYKKNVVDLANKIVSMPPQDSVKIMIKWEDPLIIHVLRQMDRNAEESGTVSISSYLISLMPKDKASRIMYLMTQI
jgi:hypothetical protein